MVFERPMCVALDGFTLHAATRAGGLDVVGREALLKYVLRPAVAQESPFGDHEARRVTRGPDGLVRITLKKPFSDGTVAVDMEPLSLLSRLAASVPAPRFSPFGDHEARHTVRYAGVLASASKLRPRLAPKPAVVPTENAADLPDVPRGGCYRPWAELLKRTFWVRRSDVPMLRWEDEAPRDRHPQPSCSGSAASVPGSNRLGNGPRAPCKCTAPRSPDIRQLVKSGLIRLRSLSTFISLASDTRRIARTS